MAYALDSGGRHAHYPRELWAADWHKRFLGGTDARQTLTWKDRSASTLPVVHNFFSSTEDVLVVRPGTLTENVGFSTLGLFNPLAWEIQEKAKGNKVTLLGASVTGSDYGGWGFNTNDGVLSTYPKWYVVDEVTPGRRRVMTANEIGIVDAPTLSGSRWNPLFKSGWGRYTVGSPLVEVVDTSPDYYAGPAWIVDLYDPNLGSSIVADPAKRNQLLAEAIPALSPPAGMQPLNRLAPVRNYPMPLLYADPATWPTGRGVNEETGTPNWLHSDLRNVAYLHTYKLFDKIVSISNQ